MSDSPSQPVPGAQRPASPPSTQPFWVGRERVLLAALLLLAVVAIAIWQSGIWTGTPAPHPTPGANNTSSTVAPIDQPQGRLLLELANRTPDMPGAYQVVMFEQTSNSNVSLELRLDGSARSAQVRTPLYNRTFVWLPLEGNASAPNASLLCETPLGDSTRCTPLNSSAMSAAASNVLDKFYPAPNQTQAALDSYRHLMADASFRFAGNASLRTIAGRDCWAILYHIGQADLEVCLDKEYGVLLSQNMTYDQPYTVGNASKVLYKRATYSLAVQRLEFAPQSIQAPGQLIDLDSLRTQVLSDDEQMDSLVGCQGAANASEQDRCLKDSAVSYSQVVFCDYSTNATALGDCVIKVATRSSQLRPELCPRAGVMASECYANIAYLKKDRSYCALVTDASLRAACEQMLDAASAAGTTGANAPTPSPASTPAANLTAVNGTGA